MRRLPREPRRLRVVTDPPSAPEEPDGDGPEVDFVGVPVDAPELAGGREAVVERFAMSLAQDPDRGGGGDDVPQFVATYAMQARLSDSPDLVDILLAARDTVRGAAPGAFRARHTANGLVARLHGQRWSVVLRVNAGAVVILLLNDGSRYGWRVDGDADWTPELDAMVSAFFDEIERRGGDDRGEPSSAF